MKYRKIIKELCLYTLGFIVVFVLFNILLDWICSKPTEYDELIKQAVISSLFVGAFVWYNKYRLTK